MPNNTSLNPGVGGDVMTTLDLSAFTAYPTTGKVAPCIIYVGPVVGAAPTPLSNANPLPVAVQTALPAGAATIGGVTQASGPWTQNLTQVGGVGLALGQAAMAASLPVTLATNQSAVPVSQSGSWAATITGPVSQTGGPWTQNLTQVGGTSVTLGQKAMGSSVPVTLATDQAAVPASQSGAWSMTIGAGAATIGAVTQASGPWTANITQIGGSALAFGQALMASSIPMVIASNQSAIPVSQSGTWNATINTALPAGGATIGAVTQASGPWTENLTQIAGTAIDVNSGNKSAGTQRVVIATDQPALTNSQPANVNQIGGSALAFGQAAMVSSIPVAIASNQAAFPVSQSGSNWTQNLVQVNGTTVDTNSGNKSAGTVRIVLATDQPIMTNAQPVSQSGTWALGNLEAGLAAGTAPAKMAVAGAQYNTTTPAATNAQTIANQCDPTGAVYVQASSRLPTYLFSSNLMTLAASATDIAIFQGSASKICKLRKIRMWFYGSAVFVPGIQVSIVTRSTNDTAGTPAGGSSQFDPSDPAVTATPKAYTANPTLGTGVATIHTFIAYPMSTHAAPTAGLLSSTQGYYEIDHTILGTEPLVFRDANHGVAVYLNASTITGGQAAVEFIWTEE